MRPEHGPARTVLRRSHRSKHASGGDGHRRRPSGRQWLRSVTNPKLARSSTGGDKRSVLFSGYDHLCEFWILRRRVLASPLDLRHNGVSLKPTHRIILQLLPRRWVTGLTI
jgi:hypothetical protein